MTEMNKKKVKGPRLVSSVRKLLQRSQERNKRQGQGDGQDEADEDQNPSKLHLKGETIEFNKDSISGQRVGKGKESRDWILPINQQEGRNKEGFNTDGKMSAKNPSEKRRKKVNTGQQTGPVGMKNKKVQVNDEESAFKDEVVEAWKEKYERFKTRFSSMEEKRVKELQKHLKAKEELHGEIRNLEDKIEEMKIENEKKEDESIAWAKVKKISNENIALKEDAEVSMSVIRRLNEELIFYQSKLRKNCENEEIHFYSSSSQEEHGGMTPVKYIGEPKFVKPLLTAYDEVIEEKDEIIKDHEIALEKFKVKVQEVVDENEELHKTISESKEKGSVSFEEWQTLFENSVLVLEENDLLHDKNTVLNRKLRIIQSSMEDQLLKAQEKVLALEEEKGSLKVTIGYLEKNCEVLKEQNRNLSQILEKRISIEQHEDAVSSCQRAFEELKKNYDEERKSLYGKLTAMDKEKERVIIEMNDCESENLRLNSQLHSLLGSLSGCEVRLKEFSEKAIEASKERDSTVANVSEMIVVLQNALYENEGTKKALADQKSLNAHLIDLRNQENVLVEELKKKIEAMEELRDAESCKVEEKCKEVERIVGSVEGRHKEEIRQMKEMLTEKSKEIDSLSAEKRQLTLDLETVWKVTIADRIKLPTR